MSVSGNMIRPTPAYALEVPNVAGKVVATELSEVDFSVSHVIEPVSPFAKVNEVPAVSVPAVVFT